MRLLSLLLLFFCAPSFARTGPGAAAATLAHLGAGPGAAAATLAHLGAGPGDGGGGDEIGLEFQASVRSALEIIRVSGRSEFGELLRLDWNALTKGMKVLTVDRKLFVTVRGVTQESAAVNHPASKLVEVNRARWKALAGQRLKEGLALHETLSLGGLEQTGVYPYSGLYLSLFNYAPDPILGGGGGGSHDVALPGEVSKVYSYRCRRLFLEGEGVEAGQISCVPGQHLGVLSAPFTFYLYSRPEKNNFSSRSGDAPFSAPICGRNDLLRLRCDTGAQLEFGLSAKQAGAFVVGVTMTAAPEGTGPLSELYGYAALPDAQGRCPANLVEVRPWSAQPASIIQGSLDGTNPPSSFINGGNALNDTVISAIRPVDFVVDRQPNAIPCDATTGDCSYAQFGGMFRAQSVAYSPLTPKLCVIPKGAL